MISPRTSIPIIWRHDTCKAEYEEARVGRVFNHRRPQRFPRAVVQATCEYDIQKAVQIAIAQNCRVSIRSGGHSWAAWSVRDDAILIDLGNYHHLELDEATLTVTASPSTTGRTLNSVLATHGLMFAGGHCPDVGIGGFLLQGGMGWNCKNWGWACEQVLGLDIVTAAGELVRCNAQQNPDLFWTARGAGPGFPGVVTKFHLRVRPAYRQVHCSNFFYPIARFREVMDWITKLAPTFDTDTEIVAVGLYPPAETGLDELCVMAGFTVFKNSRDEACQALEAANSTRPAGAQYFVVNEPTSLACEYTKQAAANPEQHRYCADNAYLTNDADVGATLEEAFSTLPHRKSFALWFSMAPTSRRPLPDMALSMHSDHYLALYTVWEDEGDDARCRSWVRGVMSRMERSTVGAYLGDSDFQSRRTKFWSDANATRLMALRRKWDPDGRICGYLDVGDQSGVKGLENRHEWLDE